VQQVTAIDQLRRAELIRIDSITYRYDTNFAEPRTRTRRNICLRKAPGELSFSLTSADLALPIDGLTFRLVEGIVDEENSVVTWNVDEAFDLWTTYRGILFQVQRVTATVSLRVMDDVPRLSIACDGTERLVRTVLTTALAPPSTLTIQTNLTGVVVNDVTLQGDVGEELEPVHFGVAIRPRTTVTNGCGYHYQRLGTMIDLSVGVFALRADEGIESISYTWSVSDGLRIEGERTRRDVDVELLEPGSHEVRVDVVVTTSAGRVAGRHATHRFAVLTPEAEALSRMLCALMQDTLPTWIEIARGLGESPIRDLVDPLWDPAPHMRRTERFMTRTFALSELVSLQRSFDETSARMKKALKLVDRVAEQEARVLRKALPAEACAPAVDDVPP
jgi:hypothetical protein